MSSAGHLVMDVARALPGEHVAHQPLPLALPDQRLHHAPQYSLGWNWFGSGGGRYIRLVFSAT